MSQPRPGSPPDVAGPTGPPPLLTLEQKNIPPQAESDPFPPQPEDLETLRMSAEEAEFEASVALRPDATNLAEFDLDTGPGNRFDQPAPIQLETGGATSQTAPTLRTSVPEASQPEFWARQTQHKFSIAAKLRTAGREDLAQKLEDCHSRYTFTLCNACGRSGRFPNRCDQFYCPECQPRLARERKDSILWWANEVSQPKHVVLTMQNIPDLTQGHVHELKHCFGKLRRRKFASNWLGGFYGVECTNEGRGWHIHLHALINARWIDGGELARQWASVTNGFGKIVKVKDCRQADYLAEVTKYAVKGSQLAKWTPDQIVTFIEAFSGVRTFGVFGQLYGKRTEFAEWLASLREAKPKCECGSCDLAYFTEAEWLMRDLKPNPPASPRPPPPTPQPELALADPRSYDHH